jgi:hypothetical protein
LQPAATYPAAFNTKQLAELDAQTDRQHWAVDREADMANLFDLWGTERQQLVNALNDAGMTSEEARLIIRDRASAQLAVQAMRAWFAAERVSV